MRLSELTRMARSDTPPVRPPISPSSHTHRLLPRRGHLRTPGTRSSCHDGTEQNSSTEVVVRVNSALEQRGYACFLLFVVSDVVASSTRDVERHGDEIAELQVLHVATHLHDLTRDLVTQIHARRHTANVATVPETQAEDAETSSDTHVREPTHMRSRAPLLSSVVSDMCKSLPQMHEATTLRITPCSETTKRERVDETTKSQHQLSTGWRQRTG